MTGPHAKGGKGTQHPEGCQYNARSLRRGPKGTVFVSSRLQDKVHAIVEKDGKREVKVIASGLHRPNGIVVHKGALYIARYEKGHLFSILESCGFEVERFDHGKELDGQSGIYLRPRSGSAAALA